MIWYGGAGLVFASYRPGPAEAPGTAYDTRSDINSDLTYGHVTGCGSD